MIITLRETIEISRDYVNKGKKVGLITGCFDILHIGQIKFFREAKENVDILIVGVESDKSIELSKGKGRPINTLKDRLEQLE